MALPRGRPRVDIAILKTSHPVPGRIRPAARAPLCAGGELTRNMRRHKGRRSSSMAAVTASRLAVVLCAVLAVAGCTSGNGGQSGQQTTTTVTETTPTPTDTTPTLNAECSDVADATQALLTE